MDTKKKAYLGVLLVSLCGLAVDRLFLDGGGAPAPAAAEPAPGEPPPSAPAVSQTAALPAAPSRAGGAAVRIADRLQALPGAAALDLARVRDAFCPAESWTIEARPVPKVAPEPVGPSPEELFRKAHKLTAIMASGDTGKAMVGTRVLALGQRLDGFVLERIDVRSATFTRGQATVVLLLKD